MAKSVLLKIFGVLSIILGIVCFMLDTGEIEYSYSYGGDAYTGIQNASAQTANNVKDVASICKFGFGSVLIVLGGTIFAISLSDKDQAMNNLLNKLNEKLSSDKEKSASEVPTIDEEQSADELPKEQPTTEEQPLDTN